MLESLTLGDWNTCDEEADMTYFADWTGTSWR